MRRVAVGEPAVLTLTITDEDGDPVAATGDVTVTITDYFGDTVATGTASTSETGLYKFPLPAVAVDALDSYVATWAATVSGIDRTYSTPFEVVGGHYFEVADLRGFNLSIEENPSRYTAAKIREARDTATERFEKECELAFVARRTRSIVEGKGRRRLILPWNNIRTIFAVTIDGEPMTEAEIDTLYALDYGVELPEGQAWPAGASIWIDYEHGLDVPEPSVQRAVKMMAVDYLVPSSLPARATSESTDLGTIRYSLAGRDGATGIPEVDAVIAKYGRGVFTVA